MFVIGIKLVFVIYKMLFSPLINVSVAKKIFAVLFLDVISYVVSQVLLTLHPKINYIK